jgi:hypothetical protein
VCRLIGLSVVRVIGKIDDPIDASPEAFPEEPEGLGRKLAELALNFGGLAFRHSAVRPSASAKSTVSEGRSFQGI